MNQTPLSHSWLHFMVDWMKNYKTQLPVLLEAQVPILIYAGDADFICNWMGNEAWTLTLDWSGAEAYRSATEEDWIIPVIPTAEAVGKADTGASATANSGQGSDEDQTQVAGKIRSGGGLTFLRVEGAGHMCPMDQPHSSLELLRAFTKGELAAGRQGTSRGVVNRPQ